MARPTARRPDQAPDAQGTPRPVCQGPGGGLLFSSPQPDKKGAARNDDNGYEVTCRALHRERAHYTGSALMHWAVMLALLPAISVVIAGCFCEEPSAIRGSPPSKTNALSSGQVGTRTERHPL